jgi:phosphoribosylglycinamide formyltransferase-1
MVRLGILGSTKGTDMQAIISSISSGELAASIGVVISNKSDAYILTRAKKHGLTTEFIDHRNKTREVFDQEISKILEQHGIDLVLLIGFMRILSPWFCSHWEGRVFNVHPSLLPLYAGGMDTNVHEAVIKNGDEETGCTIHMVTEDLDAGPIIVQKKCIVEKGDTPETLKEKVQCLEGEAFIEAIQKFDSGELKA